MTMTASPEFFVLDVGHGSCAVMKATSCVVFDAGTNAATLIDFLAASGIMKIDAMLISHADEDHIRGLISLLGASAVQIDTVFIAPDSKNTKVWKDLRSTLRDARTSGAIQLRTSLNAAD